MDSFKILLVDDSPVVRMVVFKQLELLGFLPDLSEDGLQAVAAAKEKIYDLIFMDVMMPNLDGLEATRQIRAFEQDAGRRRTRIVGVTGYTDRSACIDAGMDDFLFKPVSLDQLRGAVKRWLPGDALPAAAALLAMFADSEPINQSDIADKRISELKVRLGFNDAVILDNVG